ncbi:hypothetical protein POTOM_003231 [Populus tomentosa]|uniref:Uncharacterized protein n=1 Tax=Populus tomentosa TaxID=118781 RepID=A0A8X8DL01_POPTO|nr:hypothetical protein POTOM_003231 [Populus tomentosa]
MTRTPAKKASNLSKLVFSIVIHVARGNRIALAPAPAPAVLACIYRDIYDVVEGEIAESTLLGIPKGKHDGLTVKLWLAQYWDKLKQKVESVSLVLDSAKESFIWCPYAIDLESWDFFKFHGEKQMWATAGSSLNEDLMAFAQRVRVSMLCAVDYCSAHQF